jgi:AraC-like DNA-binding protein
MICQRIKPAPSVSEYIKEYLLVHFKFDDKAPKPIKAYPTNPEEGFTFQIRGTLIAEKPELNCSETPAKTYIFGQPDKRQNFHLTHEFMFVSVRFHPGAMFRLLKIPMTEFYDRKIDAELILGQSSIKEVNDQMANAPSYAAIPPILDAFFLKKINKIKYTIQPMDSIGRLILTNPQEFNLAKIAHAAYLSPRQFEKRFVQQAGLSPKHYARVCRFYQAFMTKEYQPNLNWQTIAFNSGYTDYQHLVKDFKQFAGTTPNSLIKETHQNPERRLNITPDFRGV